MNMYKNVSVLTLCVALIGCSSDQLPNDTVVRIAPGDKMINVASVFEEDMFCFTDGGLYQDVPLLITVSDGQGTPLGDAEVGVYADFTGNTFNGVDVLQLYRDRNGNGVIDAPEELVTSNTSDIFRTDTDKYDGSTSLMLRMFLTCPYEGEIYVFSGTSSATMNVGVSFLSEVQTEGELTGGGETDSADAGTADSGATDSGGTDAGTTGSGSSDAGTSTFGSTDAGSTTVGSADAGTSTFGAIDE